MTTVHLATFDTPVGPMRCASTREGLAWVELPRANGCGFAGWLARFAPGAQVREAWSPNRQAVGQILEYLEGKRRRFELPLDLRATAFQRRVYDVVQAIPFGETRSYADVAEALGSPGAARAVGSANGANPLPLVVPCHRVVARGGKLGGYGGGLALKRWLLAMEHAGRPAADELL